jgi:hypothetical protein
MTGPRRGRSPVTRFHLAIKVWDIYVPRIPIVPATRAKLHSLSSLQTIAYMGYLSILFCYEKHTTISARLKMR